jgi:DNA-binding NtrC family response regulator
MTATILIVDDEVNARNNYATYLQKKDFDVIEVGTLAEAKENVRLGSSDIILLDVQLPDGYGTDLLEETAMMPMRPPIILITAFGDINMAVEAMKNGAHDFLEKPIQLAQLERSIQRALEIVAMRRELAHLRQVQEREMDFVIGKSKAMQRVIEHARRAAQASVSVLITGQTGSGKEIIARAIHKMGPRANKPFIAINCAAIQPTILESELFGYEAGAFTGADKRKPGLMETADEGILFLDEISSMPIDIQAKLLRVLEDQKLRRVGGTHELKVDVQIVAASNRDLPGMIADNKFRDDLYYRLKVIDLHLPMLKERKEDIPDLVGMFMRHNNIRLDCNITDITPRAMKALMTYHWPGNIRELRNYIERAMLFCDSGVIDLEHLPPEITCLA